VKLVTRIIDPIAQDALLAAGLSPVLARLYAARGVRGPDDLSVDLARLIAPDGLKNVDAAAELLAQAIDSQKHVVIVADYDCDGATACAVGVRGLRMFGVHVDYLVPNRFEYGYGLTPEIVRLAQQRFSPDLLITVDNGIASVEGVAEANALGMAVLITDHHLAGDQLPDAACIVNPNQPGCGFASKHLAGVGVMFYVLLALRRRLRERGVFTALTQPHLDQLLDLVALGTVADVVCLDANNRRLVSQGLKRIGAGQMQPGVAALFIAAGREARSANAFDLGFALGPRINAAGRLADMSLGIECLVTDDSARAQTIARELDAINGTRREIEASMQDDALASLDLIQAEEAIEGRASLCLFDAHWHQGVVGILASRLKDRFHRPTIIFAPAGDGTLRGSGRSIVGLHLRDVLDRVSKGAPKLILRFGGHAMAAGLTIDAGDLQAFTDAFDSAVRASLEPALLMRTLETDGSLADSEATSATARALAAQVWGQGFAAPLFCDDFTVLTQRILKDKHLKLALRSKADRTFEAIWFNHAEPLPSEARIAYRLAENHYNGTSRLQLIVEHAEAP